MDRADYEHRYANNPADPRSREQRTTGWVMDAGGLIVGSIWASASHPDRPDAGLGLLQRVAALGVPTYAIGGVTALRAAEARDAGAWGVAAISALWDAADTEAAACAMLAPWQTMTEGAVACS
jgi:thiamine monophosphate synthase